MVFKLKLEVKTHLRYLNMDFNYNFQFIKLRCYRKKKHIYTNIKQSIKILCYIFIINYYQVV